MQYTITFFAASADELACRMRETSHEILERVRDYLENACDNPKHIPSLLSAADAICIGKLPVEASQDYFDAFFSIMNTEAEVIAIPLFQFNNSAYIEDIGIWPWTQQCPPPFPVPKSTEELAPQIGFLSCAFMREVVLPGIELLPACQLGGTHARIEFGEVVESVVEDGLDLIAFFSVW